MRLYGKKFFRHRMDEAARVRQETRDAILWDVLSTQRLCRVKIQGSNELIVAYYPENWEKTPFWLKPGNAVKVVHTQGVRGRIEVIGHGQVVPTPISGGTFPDPITPPDCILTGCLITQIFNVPQMAVFVHGGTYRIGGVDYTLDSIAMSNSAIYALGEGGSMEDIAGKIAINAAPATGQFRYDAIVVGADGVLDYVPGTASATPVKPDIPASHLLVGDYIFVPSGTTEITQANIGATWSAPIPNRLVITIADDDLAWGQMSTNIMVQVKDQYGNPLGGTGYGWYIVLSFELGNGTLHSDEEGDSTSSIGAHTGVLSYYNFTYTRFGIDPGDISPLIRTVVEIDVSVEMSNFIILRNAGGDIMR